MSKPTIPCDSPPAGVPDHRTGRGPGRQWSHQPAARPRLERRADKPDAPPMIVGYAAVFFRAGEPGTEYRLYEDAYERVMPTAFDAALRENDLVRGLTNHDDQWLLGRSDLGTVRLSIDRVGLRYEIDPPDTQAGRDTVALLSRGDLDGSSFGFRCYGGKRGKTAWIEEARDGRQVSIREIHDCELLDVGPVTYPAYQATSAGVRSDAWVEEARADHDRWQARQAAERTAEAANVSIPADWEFDCAIAGADLLTL